MYFLRADFRSPDEEAILDRSRNRIIEDFEEISSEIIGNLANEAWSAVNHLNHPLSLEDTRELQWEDVMNLHLVDTLNSLERRRRREESSDSLYGAPVPPHGPNEIANRGPMM